MNKTVLAASVVALALSTSVFGYSRAECIYQGVFKHRHVLGHHHTGDPKPIASAYFICGAIGKWYPAEKNDPSFTGVCNADTDIYLKHETTASLTDYCDDLNTYTKHKLKINYDYETPQNPGH